MDGGRKPFILQRISCGFSCYGCFIGNIQVVQVASDSVEVVCLCCFGNEGAAGQMNGDTAKVRVLLLLLFLLLFLSEIIAVTCK